ncbi:lysophospholipid acyltransferase family protein [Pseudokordiimonas caeni]|uniref:lysophospholipid acyltransferase family protein n=1 Tax=Pseudokordiimonas caeni TaxID=2997908 RepID=UPI0028128B61|nr:1-acyl-sn-glycerol-3-phosphate acyltransferase [Pseudokordiimonas caeni]
MIHRLTDALRSVLFNLTFYPFTILYTGILSIFCYLPVSQAFVRKGIHGYCLGSAWIARIVMGIKWEYRGLENLPKTGPVIIAAAHQSNLDPILTYNVRQDVTALAKKELFGLPFIGPILSKVGIIRVDRQSGTAHKEMDAVSKIVHDGGQPIIVYPQATRTKPGQYRPLKSGAYFIQKAGGLPVVPVATNTGLFWRKGFFHRSGIAVFEIGAPIPSGLTKDEFMKAIERDVVKRSDELFVEAGYGHLLPASVDKDK